MLTNVRFDMRTPDWGPADAGTLYRASLDMAAWADRVGLDTIVLSEHHDADDGFLPWGPHRFAECEMLSPRNCTC